jgi:hypothetical protein
MNGSLVRRYTLGGIIKTSFGLFFRHFWALAGGAVIIMAPWRVFDWLVTHHLPHGGGTMALQLISAFTAQFAVPLVFLQVNDVVRGLNPSLGRSLKVYASDRFWPFFATFIVVWLAVVFGFVLLIIPGLIASAFYLFAMIIATLEGKNVRSSMRKSRTLGKGCYIRNIGVLYASWFAIGLPVFMAYLLLAAIVGAAVGLLFPTAVQDRNLFSLVELLIMILGSVIVTPLALPQILLYYDMRARKEGLDDNRFVEELRLAGFDDGGSDGEGLAWTPARS